MEKKEITKEDETECVFCLNNNISSPAICLVKGEDIISGNLNIFR
jgi:hypothetical protein